MFSRLSLQYKVGSRVLNWLQAIELAGGQTEEKSISVVKVRRNKGMNNSLAGIKRHELSNFSDVTQMEHTHSDDVVDVQV